MRRLVNDPTLYREFLDYLESQLAIARNTLESATDPVQIHRLQGQIMTYRRLQKLRETVNARLAI